MDLHAFLATLADPSLSDDDIWEESQELICALAESSILPDDLAMKTLANRIDYEPSRKRKAMIAAVAGALVEEGGDPWEIAEVVLQPIPGWLENANRLLEACLQHLDQHVPAVNEDEEEEEDDDELGDIWLQEPLDDELDVEDPPEESAFEQTIEAMGRDMPEEADCWQALNYIWQPAVTLLSRESKLRQAGRPHRPLAQQMADYHEGAYWLSSVYDVLDNEPILIVSPAKKTGFRGSISGVADNMQLQTLLIDAAYRLGIDGPCRLSESVVQVATGNGPQSVDEVVEVQWNMYSWEALGPDHRLPNPGDYNASDHWIWGEGTPADIPVFDGFRVILIGPPSYKRAWPVQRRFSAMRAELSVDSTLSGADVERWLNRMSAEKLSDR